LPSEDTDGARVLIVEDDPVGRRVVASILVHAGLRVEEAADGAEAITRFREHSHDVVVSDISMPGMDGLELLKAIRNIDLDVPIILITGSPSLDSAIRAVEYGAFHYLTKPLDFTELSQVTTRAVQLGQLARLKRQAMALAGQSAMLAGDRAGLEASLGRALSNLYLVHQPIIRSSDHAATGCEVLMRHDGPGLSSPIAILEAAEQLDRVADVGMAVRQRVNNALETDALNGRTIFVNLHPQELSDQRLYSDNNPLHRAADRIVLEITERASLHGIKDLRGKIASLRERGYRLAIDDLGAGYSGLTAFASLHPDFVKFDRALIRGIDADPLRQKLVGSLTRTCHELNMAVIAEGIETEAENQTCQELGCDYVQGFYLQRPQKL